MTPEVQAGMEEIKQLMRDSGLMACGRIRPHGPRNISFKGDDGKTYSWNGERWLIDGVAQPSLWQRLMAWLRSR